MARGRTTVEGIGGDGARELGWSLTFLACEPIAGQGDSAHGRGYCKVMKQLTVLCKRMMKTARSQLVETDRREENWFFAMAAAASKTARKPREYLGPSSSGVQESRSRTSTPHVRSGGAESYVHRNRRQCGVSSKFHPYAKCVIVVGPCRNPCA